MVGKLEQRKIGFKSLQESIAATNSGGKLILFHMFGALAGFERNLKIQLRKYAKPSKYQSLLFIILYTGLKVCFELWCRFRTLQNLYLSSRAKLSLTLFHLLNHLVQITIEKPILNNAIFSCKEKPPKFNKFIFYQSNLFSYYRF